MQYWKKLEKIEIVNGCIDDHTSTIIGYLCLESSAMFIVIIHCQEMDWFSLNLAKQAFMVELRLRYFNDINLRFFSLLLDRISSMNLTTLELSFGKINSNPYPIRRMVSLRKVKRIRFKEHSSPQLIQQFQAWGTLLQK